MSLRPVTSARIQTSNNTSSQRSQRKGSVFTPAKYFQGLSAAEKAQRLQRIRQGAKSDHTDPTAYAPFKTDFRKGVRLKTKPSRYTLQFRKLFPHAQSLPSKAEKTGVPLPLLRKVYNRGLAAWRTGHRPGANAQQWGYARVHSFLVKGKTFYTADKDIARQALENPTAVTWFQQVEGLCDTRQQRDDWCPQPEV